MYYRIEIYDNHIKSWCNICEARKIADIMAEFNSCNYYNKRLLKITKNKIIEIA